MTRGRRGRSTYMAILVLLVVMIVPVKAGAVPGVTIFHIRGAVTDPIGRPLAGVLVDDGHQTVLTDAQGRYDLPEEELGTYTVRARRSDTVTKTQVVAGNVPLDKVADFILEYRINAVLDRGAISTASGAATATVTVSSMAPNPGTPGTPGASCVSVTDSRTGATSSANHAGSNPDGSHRWTWLLEVPQGTSEREYQVSYAARDCSSATPLTAAPITPYLIDNTVPVLREAQLVPLGGGNTVAPNQPLEIGFDDVGSGVNPASVEFTLTNLSTGQVTNYSGGDVTVDHQNRFAKTTSAPMNVGDRYRVEVRASDEAGNQALPVQGTFAAIRTTAGAATSNIDNTAGIRSENLKLDGTRTFTFKDVVVTIPAYDVTVAGTPEHAGFGYVGRTIDLRAAKIHLYKQVGTSYQELPGSPVNAPASWGTRRSYGQLVALRTDEANPTWHVEDLSLSLPSLEADLNGLADKAVLSLATPAPVFSTTCNDPNGACSATAWSTPDPMPFYLSDGDAAKLAADWRRAQDSFVAAGAASTDLNYSALGLVYALEYDPLVAVGWQVLTAVSTSDQLIWEQLEYQQGYPLYLPRTYATDCARLACNSRQATLDSGQSFRVSASSGGRSCQTFDEEDRESVKRCTQYAQMYSIHQYRGGTSHFWGGSMMATLGWHEGDNDHLNLGLKMTKLPVFDASSTSSEALYAEWTYYPDNPQNPDGGGTCQNEPYSGGPATQNIHRPAAWARDVNDYWFGWRLQEFGSSDDRAGVRQANWNDEYVDAFYCGVDHAPANRISFALMHTYGWVQDGRNNEAGRFALAYGHNKTQTRWKFGCGPGFDFVPKPGVGVGCGWEPQSEDTRVWTIASVQEFRY